MPDQDLQEQFTRLWTDAQPTVSHYVHSMVRDSSAAKDVIQSTAIVLLRKFANYDPDREFLPWALGVAKFEVLSHRRDHARNVVQFNSELMDQLTDQLSRSAIRSRLSSFAETAFRRPVEEGELDPILELVSGKLDEGLEPLSALQLGFQTILSSPGFIYLAEGEGPLDDHALASRLAYFLWSSGPDAALLNAARKGELSDPKELTRQVDRMLADPKSGRFVMNFVRLWLDVDNIGEMPISKEFGAYFRDNLETAMRAETETFLRHLLDNNLPPSEFLTADYTFLNRELGMHYGIGGLEGNHMRKVSLAGSGRGGLTSQALFLTASANGVDTSPVVRGIYVLEKVLGYTPPPPPPDVPVIESDINGATSIREQLKKHREVASCAECHRKIDPLGFALENYDAIGGWRDQYGGGIPVDTSGELPNGD